MPAGFKLTERDYRYLFENASDAMWVHDMDGRFLDANHAFEKLSGYTLKDWAGLNVARFLAPDSLATARDVRERLLRGDRVEQPYEQRFVVKGDMIRTVKMSTSTVVINGQTVGFQHVARDITEEKRTSEMLTKIIDGSPIPTFVISRDHLITHWNVALARLSGLREEEMLGTSRQWQPFYREERPTLADLIVEGASAESIAKFYTVRPGKSNMIAGAYESTDFIPDGRNSGRWLHFTASPIRNEDKEIMAAIETLQDVTREQQLQESMSFYVSRITETQEAERKRISRELHDDVSPSLLLLIQRLDALQTTARPKLSAVVSQRLEDLRVQAVATLEQLRRCAQDLRPRILDDLGLVAALEWVADDLGKDQNMAAHVKVIGVERVLPLETQLLLFRIAQEALNNVRKHSGATGVDITVEFGTDKVVMVVQDNGRGFQCPDQLQNLAAAGKLGIVGMMERARLLRGSLSILSWPDKGTRVITEVPA